MYDVGSLYLLPLIWFACGCLAYIIAKGRGASTNGALGWFLLAFLVGPLSPLGALFFSAPKKATR